MPIVLSATVVAGTNAPTLQSPTDASTSSLQGGVSCSFQYNPSVSGRSPSAWLLERQILGVGVWQWWNAALGEWTTTAVQNPWGGSGTTQTVAFPAGTWPDGHSYAWSAATVDQGGQSDYAEPFTVNGAGAVGVAITAPSGNVDVSDPLVTWTGSWPAGFQQAGFEVVVESGVASGATAPGTGTTLYDSGLVTSNAQSVRAPVAFPEGVALVVWVRLTGTAGLISEWASSDWSPVYTQPSAPSLSATAATWPATGHPCVNLSANWSVANLNPGSNAQAVVQFFYSEDQENWYSVRNGSTTYDAYTTQSGTATATDHEVAPGVERYYQAALFFYGTANTTPPVGVNRSVSPVANVLTTTTSWWLKHLTQPDLSVPLYLDRGSDLSLTRQDSQQSYWVDGREDPIILSDVIRMPTITVTIKFISDAAYHNFLALRETTDIYLFQGPSPAGAWYVRLGAVATDNTDIASLRWGAPDAVVRTVTIDMQAVASAGQGFTVGPPAPGEIVTAVGTVKLVN